MGWREQRCLSLAPASAVHQWPLEAGPGTRSPGSASAWGRTSQNREPLNRKESHVDCALHPCCLVLKCPSRSHPGTVEGPAHLGPAPGPWACGCTDNALQVGGLAGLAPATHSSSNWTHLFLLRACSAPLSGHTVQIQLTPHLRSGATDSMPAAGCAISLGRWLPV